MDIFKLTKSKTRQRVIKLAKFGDILTSRPAGREAYLYARAYLLSRKPKKIEIIFDGVKVLTPSWMDEFISPMVKDFGEGSIVFQKSTNPTVSASLKILSI